MKLCKDCKHHRRDWFANPIYESKHLCAHPSAGLDVVTGETDVSCYAERSKITVGHCGKEGKNWEAR